MRKYRPTAKGYFSGAGGMEIGAMQAGIKIIQSLDIDKTATDCMTANLHYFKHSVLTQDIKDICVKDQTESDIIIGTYPCNKYSTIADIHGTREGEDLYLHFFRHTAIERPEMFYLENVPGMKKFKVVMEAMTRLPGYHITVLCPVSAQNWLPQRRDRLIIIGTKRPFTITAPKIKRTPKISEILEHNAQVEVTDSIISRIQGKYRDKPIIIDPSDPNAIAPTCVAHYSKDMGTRLVVDTKYEYGLRPFTVREYARLQGFPDDYQFRESRNSYRLIGNAVPVPMARWIGEQAMKYFN